MADGREPAGFGGMRRVFYYYGRTGNAGVGQFTCRFESSAGAASCGSSCGSRRHNDTGDD